jgi:integrase
VSVHKHTYQDGRVGYYVKHQGRTARRFDPRKYGGTREAERAARRHDLALHTGENPDRGKTTVAEVADVWWEREHAAWTGETRATYAAQLDNRILPRWGGMQVRMVTPRGVEEWMDDLKRKGTGAPTVRTALAVLSGVMERAITDGEIDANPVRAVRWPSGCRSRDPVMIAPATVELARAWLLQQGRHRDAALLSLLAYAGPRPESEALPLTWDRVKLGEGVVIFQQTKRKGDPVDRPVGLLGPLVDDLRAWRTHGGAVKARGLVFGEWSPSGWDNWRTRVFRPAMVHAGAPLDAERRRRLRDGTVEVVKTTSWRPRDLRASFVSLLVFSGMNPVEIGAQTGHTVETLLRVYAGVFRGFDPAERRPAVEVVTAAREAATFSPGSHASRVSGTDTRAG